MDEYNYFISGHVKDIKVLEAGSPTFILMAIVNPSQSSVDKARVAVKDTHGWLSF